MAIQLIKTLKTRGFLFQSNPPSELATSKTNGIFNKKSSFKLIRTLKTRGFGETLVTVGLPATTASGFSRTAAGLTAIPPPAAPGDFNAGTPVPLATDFFGVSGSLAEKEYSKY